jgi:hypothetical protein
LCEFLNFNFFTENELKQNATSTGRFKVYRGVKEIEKVGEVITVEGSEESKAYSGTCNKIKGTDGTV